MKFLTGILISLLASTPDESRTEGDWERVGEDGEMRIYTRESVGGGIRKLRVEARVKSTVAQLLGTYLDVENQVKWFPGCETARVIGRKSDSSLTVYRRIRNPWPFQDRDYAILYEVRKTEEEGGILVRYRDLKDAVPVQKDCVRMRKLRGYWKFVPEKDGYVAVTYVFDFDPGGGTPATFINKALPKIGRDTVLGLFRHVGTTGLVPSLSG